MDLGADKIMAFVVICRAFAHYGPGCQLNYGICRVPCRVVFLPATDLGAD